MIKTLLILFFFQTFSQNSDVQICTQKFEFAVSKNLSQRPINEVIVEIGKTFLGTPYGEYTLEKNETENLVINLQALDCVTFYENCITLARCIKMNNSTFEEYKKQLQYIRYRNGKIDGYSSRLHYTTDYFFENEKKGVLKIVTDEIFPKKAVKEISNTINFMTTHRESYKQLKDENEYQKILAIEKEINKRTLYFLPKAKISQYEKNIQTGDIIGITTSIEGMDISHTGIAVKEKNGSAHFLHASTNKREVQLTKETLHQYLGNNKKHTGIIVARVQEPK